MPVVIQDYDEAEGTHTPSDLNQESTVYEISSDKPLLIQGFIDTSNLQNLDVIVIREYVKWATLPTYKLITYRSIFGVQQEPIWLAKLVWIPRAYKITLTQTTGTLRSFPYYFVAERVVKT